MKHLLNGVAIAAVLAIAAPAWAQGVSGQPSLQQGMPKAGTASPSAGAPSTAPMAPAAAAPMAPMAPATTATGRPNRTRGMPKSGQASASNKNRHMPRRAEPGMADQLNAQELTTLQGGGAMPMPSSNVPGQPSLQRGMPKAGSPSPSAPTP